MGQDTSNAFETRVLDWLGRHWKLVTIVVWLGFCGWFIFQRWDAIRWATGNPTTGDPPNSVVT